MWVGWVTPDYHQHDMNFDLTKVRAVTVTMGDEQGNIHSRYGEGWALAPPPFFSLPAYLPSMAPSLCLASSSVFCFFVFVFVFVFVPATCASSPGPASNLLRNGDNARFLTC